MQADLFTKYQSPVKSRATEYGELLKLFMDNLNVQRVNKFKPLTLARMGKEVKGLVVERNGEKDYSKLYELSSKCRQEAERNKAKYFEIYSKVFWYEIRK